MGYRTPYPHELTAVRTLKSSLERYRSKATFSFPIFVSHVDLEIATPTHSGTTPTEMLVRACAD